MLAEAGNNHTTLIRFAKETIAEAEHAQLAIVLTEEVFQYNRTRLLFDLKRELNNKRCEKNMFNLIVSLREALGHNNILCEAERVIGCVDLPCCENNEPSNEIRKNKAHPNRGA